MTTRVFQYDVLCMCVFEAAAAQDRPSAICICSGTLPHRMTPLVNTGMGHGTGHAVAGA